MKNETIGVGILLLVGFIFIIGLIGSSEPECSMNGCDKDAKDGSRYCYMHDLSYQTYGNPDYNAVYENSQRKRTSNTTTTGSSTSTSTSGSSTSNRTTTSSSKKTYSTYNSYDEGYEDVYEDDDYDWDRYYEDDDYATGVDDALDELDE